jgi:WXG100 family type VII secretion target
MAEIRVTSATLRAKKDELQQMNAKFMDAVNNLEATAQSLSASWEGESHDAFYKSFESDKTQMHNFYNAIQAYVTALEQIAAQYEKSEATNTQIASR